MSLAAEAEHLITAEFPGAKPVRAQGRTIIGWNGKAIGFGGTAEEAWADALRRWDDPTHQAWLKAES